nr:hypothetical protein OG513_00040 [Streptomyces sp. NBC_00998]
MTSFVITVPGTFVSDVADSVSFIVERKLASRHTEVSENEGLRLLMSAVSESAQSSMLLTWCYAVWVSGFLAGWLTESAQAWNGSAV